MKRPVVGKSRWLIIKHGIVPQTIKKEIRDLISVTKAVAEEDKEVDITSLNRQERKELVKKLQGSNAKKLSEVLDFTNWQHRSAI